MGDVVTTFVHTFQTAAIAQGNGTAMDVGGLAGVGVQVTGITNATITFEASIDEATWVAVRAMNLNSGAVATTTTANGLFLVPVAGVGELRCRISAYVAGTITVSGKGITNPAAAPLSLVGISGAVEVEQATHDDLNLNANAQVGNADVTNANPMPVSDAGGTLTVDGAVEAVAPRATVTGTITNGQSLSGAIDLTAAGTPLAIITDAAWDTNAMTFQGSFDNVTYFNLREMGVEVSIAGVVASSMEHLDFAQFLGLRYLKVRSGTAAAAVAQVGDTVVTIVCGKIWSS